MSWIIFYLSVALISMANDGSLHFAAKRRYRAWTSFWTSLIWPITAPLEIVAAVIVTRKFERWDKPLDTESK